jgi:hypothetical protein
LGGGWKRDPRGQLSRGHLQYLAELRLVLRGTKYGGAHRPEVEYRRRPTERPADE